MFFFGFSALTLFAKTSEEQKEKNSYEIAFTSVADSLVRAYSTAKTETAQLEAALPLWALFGKRPPADEIQTAPLQSIDQKSLSQFIKTAIEKPEHRHFLIDFGLLQTRDSVLFFFEQYPNIDTSIFTSRQKASWCHNRARQLYSYDQTTGAHIDLFKKSYWYCKNDEGLKALLYLCLGPLGTEEFRQHHLDAAIATFKNQEEAYSQLPTGKLLYLPSFGYFYKKYEVSSRLAMNLGMCYEKSGNLVLAKDYYETAIEAYEIAENPAGLYWGKSQLINTFLDLGNTQRAEHLLVEMAQDIHENYEDESAPYVLDYYLLPAICEFDLNDLAKSGKLVDSLLSQAELRAAPFPAINSKGAYRQNHFLNRAWSLSMHLLIAQETFGTKTNIGILRDVDQLIAMNDTARFRFSSLHPQIKNAMESIGLSWHIALEDNVEDNGDFEKLKKLLSDSNAMAYSNYQFQLSTWILHSAGKFKEELELLSMQLPKLREGGYAIDLRKTYLQMSQAFEGNGEEGKAFEYYKLYDLLRAQTQQMNQHEQLSALDKKLEVEKIERKKADLEVENQSLLAKETILRNFLIAAALVLLMAVLLIRNIRKRHQAERGRKQAEMLLLQQTVSEKEDALDNITLDLLSSNKSHGQLIEDIEALTTNLSAENRKKARSVLIDYKAKAQNQIWQEFNMEFNRANSGFFKSLKAQVPDLTKTELRICAMHLSGLSNQEIISITGQQLGSLYTLKSRVRKKLDVESDQELKVFLEKIHPNTID